MCRLIPLLFLLLCRLAIAAEETGNDSQSAPFGDRIADSPFVELYVLEELKQLRSDMAQQKNELLQQVVDRELRSVARGVQYATDTITYFFYLIAAASSALVLIGWTSVRDIREKVHNLAEEQISRLVEEYEQRLRNIEKQLNQKTRQIEQNKEEILLTQEVHSLWLRAAQETAPPGKITVYDNILKLVPDNTEALTYKADAVLELNEPQWAVNLCQQALAIDPVNGHAFYQLACAYTALQQFDDAVSNLAQALSISDAYQEELATDPALSPLKGTEQFTRLLAGRQSTG